MPWQGACMHHRLDDVSRLGAHRKRLRARVHPKEPAARRVASLASEVRVCPPPAAAYIGIRRLGGSAGRCMQALRAGAERSLRRSRNSS